MIIKQLEKKYNYGEMTYDLGSVGDTLQDLIKVLEEKKIINADKEVKREVKKENKKESIFKRLKDKIFAKKVEVKKAENKKKGRVVRTPVTADKVYYLEDDTRKWVENPVALEKLGFTFKDVENITDEEFGKYKEVEPVRAT